MDWLNTEQILRPYRPLLLEHAELVGEVEDVHDGTRHAHEVPDGDGHMHLAESFVDLHVVGTLGKWSWVMVTDLQPDSCCLLHCEFGCNETEKRRSQVEANQQFQEEAQNHGSNLKINQLVN